MQPVESTAMNHLQTYLAAVDLRASIKPAESPELAPLHQALTEALPFLGADAEAQIAAEAKPKSIPVLESKP